MTSNPLHSIPLTFDGDGYVLDVEVLDSNRVKLLTILRYPNNQTTEPVHERIQDLPQTTRAEIVRQINRKLPGRRVFVA